MPDKELVTIYGGSSNTLRFFDFENTMFVGMQNSDHYDKYTFMDNKAVGVSGLRKFYEYLVNKDSGKIESILLYKKNHL